MAPKGLKCFKEKIPMVRLAFEKMYCLRGTSKTKVSTAKDVVELMTRIYGCAAQERVYSVLLNSVNEIIGIQEISEGGLSSTQVDPRVVWSGALTAGAASILLVHNHPSGNIEPSQQDRELTKALVDGSKTLGIRVLDHVIIGGNGTYSSFVDLGLMPQ